MSWPRFPGHHGLQLEKIASCAIVKQQLAQGNILDDPTVSFQIGRVLGQGTFGKVYEAMNTKTGEMVAVKRIELKSNQLKQQIRMAESEINMMKTMRHPHIVSIRGSMMDGDVFNIIMELVAGSSLADMTKNLGALHENVTRKFTKQLLLALQYCHAMHCVHRDIKGKNILLTTDGTVRICDFGSAKIREETIDKDAVSVTYSYTPLWVAPETLNAKMYNEKVDIWALGCVVIEMASGKDPWSEKKFQSSYQAIFHIGSSEEIPLIPASLSEEGKDFCRRCLTRDPEKRPSATELLKHPFVAAFDIDALVASDEAKINTAGDVNRVPSNPRLVATNQLVGNREAEMQAAKQMKELTAMVDSKLSTMRLEAGAAGANAAEAKLLTVEKKLLAVEPTPPPPTPNPSFVGSLPSLPLVSQASSHSPSVAAPVSVAAPSRQISSPSLNPGPPALPMLDGSMVISHPNANSSVNVPMHLAASVDNPFNQSQGLVNIDRPDSECIIKQFNNQQQQPMQMAPQFDGNETNKPFNVVYTFGTVNSHPQDPFTLKDVSDNKSPLVSGENSRSGESRIYSYHSDAELNSSRSVASDMSLSHSVLEFSDGWKTFNIVPNA